MNANLKPLTKAIVVALIHIAIVSSLGAKLLYDRDTRPRAWFRALPYDPNLPIRGRYLSMTVEVPDARTQEEIAKRYAKEIEAVKHPTQYGPRAFYQYECGSIEYRNGKPVAVMDSGRSYQCEGLHFMLSERDGQYVLRLEEPVLYFIPDTAGDQSWNQRGVERWVLATIPRKGPLRPIRLGVKRPEESTIHELGLK
ncbi:MAG TPA: hypothetical protein VF786_06655 [Terriglobales bacterium]